MSRSPLKSSERANAEYVRSALRELLPMAHGSNQKLLNYLIEMAYVEVSDMLRDDHAFQKEIVSAQIEVAVMDGRDGDISERSSKAFNPKSAPTISSMLDMLQSK
jgi:hypothetical protein